MKLFLKVSFNYLFYLADYIIVCLILFYIPYLHFRPEKCIHEFHVFQAYLSNGPLYVISMKVFRNVV